jgi:hypothetical protein
MGNEEKSRDAFEPKKRYAGVGMQQGRVLLDDDWNDAERIRLEEERRVNLDVIGWSGTPDAGFSLSNGTITDGGCDFDIAAGTMYVGGLRLWNPATLKLSLQDDWLQQTAADRPTPQDGVLGLVYLEAWQQPVTAIEDTELVEVALGGPDSSTRLRTMWRVKVADASDPSCPDAWAALVGTWQQSGQGVLDGTGELVVDAKLQVGFVPGQPGDLCTPKITGGYLGAENQTIRVQLVDSGHFTWGYDNGAPLYQATIGGDRKTITLRTEPRDQQHWPDVGQVVEILPWSAVLPNGEKIAEEVGFLARVAKRYDPDPNMHSFVLDDTTLVPAGFGEAWKTRTDATALGDEFVFVRVWDRGDDVTSELAIPFGGSAVKLGDTGVEVTITGTSKVGGDHWIISARPRSPDRVVPWDLEAVGGRHVHGVRRFAAPLALIRWHADGTFDLLHDCRPFFLPLTKQRGCCTYTVGDQEHSFGQFSTIQAAVNALPDEGGKVCVLPGTYPESVYLIAKHDVTIEGCAGRSHIAPPNGGPWAIVVVGGRDLVFRDLDLQCGEGFGLVLFGATKVAWPTSVDDLDWAGGEGRLDHVLVDSVTVTGGVRSAIAAFAGDTLTIRGCDIECPALDKPIDQSDRGRWPAILSFASDVLIEDNRIACAFEAAGGQGPITYTHTVLGGIQIGGGSQRVEIRRNHVERGNGDAITLGSWAWAPAKLLDPVYKWVDLQQGWIWQSGISIHINAEGCIEVDWDPPPPNDSDGNPMVPVSMGAVTDVLVADNQLLRMGKSGVGVARFFDLSGQDEMITVQDLEIRDNRIEQCLRLPIPTVPAKLIDVVAQGAITLADVDGLLVRGNDIHDNGKQHIDPVCGVFALVSTGAVIEGNRIVDNAPHADVHDPVRDGWRGGVVLTQAMPRDVTVTVAALKQDIVRMNGEPAARVCDNQIVVPEGRAVLVIGTGPIVIADNEMMVRGVGKADIAAALLTGNTIIDDLAKATVQGAVDLLGGVAVSAFDLGMSNELFWTQLLFYSSQVQQDLEPKPGLDPRPPIAASGQIRFEDNQVGVDLLAPPSNFVMSAVNLLTLDDVACSNNQVELDRERDTILMTLLTTGMTARVLGNRVKESLISASSLLGVSIFSLGVLLNMTTGNQTSRCIAGFGLRKQLAPNQVVLEVFSKNACTSTLQAIKNVQTKMIPAIQQIVFQE